MALHGCIKTTSRRSRVFWSIGIALLIASQVLTGHPQAVYLTGLIEAGYVVCRLADRLNPFRFNGLLAVAVGGVLGLAMGAVQILPTLAVLKSSMRAKPTIEYLSDASLQPLELLQWINTLFWHAGHYSLTRSYFEMLIYCGGPLVILLFLWVILQKSD